MDSQAGAGDDASVLAAFDKRRGSDAVVSQTSSTSSAKNDATYSLENAFKSGPVRSASDVQNEVTSCRVAAAAVMECTAVAGHDAKALAAFEMRRGPYAMDSRSSGSAMMDATFPNNASRFDDSSDRQVASRGLASAAGAVESPAGACDEERAAAALEQRRGTDAMKTSSELVGPGIFCSPRYTIPVTQNAWVGRR